MGRPVHLFQGPPEDDPCVKKNDGVYSGPEHRRRGTDRPRLSDENEDLVDAIREAVACRDNCVIPKEAHEHVSHFVGAVKEFGDGSIRRGINKGLDQQKEVSSILNVFKAALNKALQTAVWVIVVGILGLIWWAFIKKAGG